MIKKLLRKADLVDIQYSAQVYKEYTLNRIGIQY